MRIADALFMFEYNYWANGQILSAASKVTQEQFLAPADYPHGGLRSTLLHIVDGERLWRVLFDTNKVTGDEELRAEDFPIFVLLQTKFYKEELLMRVYLDSLKDEDMNSQLKYTTTEGAHRDRILWHCLYHLVNHGTQHRSEAAALLTSYNSSPGDLDFTVFLNQYKK